MASVAQIQANRLNAQKSTGPRTPAGKAAVSRNAVKHGLLAEQVVIHGEDPADFEVYRDGMLAELAPVGAVEAMLAERAVGLAWRLRRAERLQGAVFATVYRENADDVVLWPKHGLPSRPGPGEDEVVLGQVVMTDFARAQVLDRLLVYERRIESSLYRTMAQLRHERQARTAAAKPEEPSRPEAGPPADQDSARGRARRSTGILPMSPTGVPPVARNHQMQASPAFAKAGDSPAAHGQDAHATGNRPLIHPPEPAELGSFGADAVAEGGAEEVPSLKGEVSSGERQVARGDSDFALPTSPLKLASITPDGVTTNPAADGNHGRVARATEPAGGTSNFTLSTSNSAGGRPAKRSQWEASVKCEVGSVKTGDRCGRDFRLPPFQLGQRPAGPQSVLRIWPACDAGDA